MISQILQGRAFRVSASFNSSLASKPVYLRITEWQDPLNDFTPHFHFKNWASNIRTTDYKAEWSFTPNQASSGFSPRSPLQILVQIPDASISVDWGPFIVVGRTRDVQADGNQLGMRFPPPPPPPAITTYLILTSLYLKRSK